MAGPTQRGPGRPGAMTQAMAAAKVSSGPKVLRIGIIQGTKMSEERIIRDRNSVTVGTTERNTFTVNANELPPSFELFTMSGGTYSLNFTEKMDGRLALPDGVKSLADLRANANTRKGPQGWQVALSESSRGKIQIGDVTFLFQFVVPPPPQPKPQLPAAIRAGWVKNIDWTYNACFSFFLVLAIASVAYIEYVYDPIVDDAGLDDARLVRLLSQPAAPEEPQPQEPEQTNEPATQEAAATPAPAAAPQRSAGESAAARERAATNRAEAAAAAATRAADAALNALNNNAEFAALTGVGESSNSARDALNNGGLMAGTERDLQNVGGISAASGQSGVRRGSVASAGGAGLGGRGLGQSGTVQGGGNNIGSGGEIVRERVIRGNASLGGGDSIGGEGNLDPNAVARLIRGQLGGIRSCYERALRNNPTLSGRVEVRFTIGTSGRITSASSSGMSEAPEVGSCVVSRIRGLVFPAPEGGSVDFSFPFTFNPGN